MVTVILILIAIILLPLAILSASAVLENGRWKWILGVPAVLLLILAIYTYRENQKVEVQSRPVVQTSSATQLDYDRCVQFTGSVEYCNGYYKR